MFSNGKISPIFNYDCFSKPICMGATFGDTFLYTMHELNNIRTYLHQFKDPSSCSLINDMLWAMQKLLTTSVTPQLFFDNLELLNHAIAKCAQQQGDDPKENNSLMANAAHYTLTFIQKNIEKEVFTKIATKGHETSTIRNRWEQFQEAHLKDRALKLK